jgi:methionyl-tRNA synthetase
MDTLEFCSKNSQHFNALFKKASVDYDRFIRTTDEDHKEMVSKMWNILKENGFIKKGHHTGYYSVNEETFVMEKDLEWDEESSVFKT